MNAILIDASKKEVSNIDLSTSPHSYLRQIHEHLGCQTYKFMTFDPTTVQALMDEDFLTNETNLAFNIDRWPLPFFGNVLLIGKNPDNGDTIDLPEDVTTESLNITFFSEEETERLRASALILATLFDQPGFDLKTLLESVKE